MLRSAVRVAPMPLAVLLLLASLSTAGAANLVANPGFEEGDAGGRPAGWSLRSAAGNPQIGLDAADRHAGARSIRISGDSADDRAFAEGPRIPVIPGKAYLFSAWMKSAGVTGGFAVLGAARYRADGSWDNWSYVARLPANRDWREYRQVWTVPAGATAIALRAWAENLQGTVWFDDVSLTEYAAPTPTWEDDFRTPALWQAHDADAVPADGGLSVRCAVTTSPERWYPAGCVARTVTADLGKAPILSVAVSDVRGLWGLDLGEDTPYIQHGTERSGRFYYDLREKPGWKGPRTFPLRIFAMGEGAQVTLSHAALLAEKPPTVEEPSAPLSRYARPDISLAGLQRDRAHPFLSITRDELARMRTRGAPFERWHKGILAGATHLVGAPVEIPDQGILYSTRYFCPKHGIPLAFDGRQPGVHRCPADGEMLTGPVFDAEWRIQRVNQLHGAARSALKTLGLAFQLTGDRRYAEKASVLFQEYARKFGRYVYHSGRGGQRREGDGTRVASEPLGEASWLADIAAAYDLVAEAMPPETARAVEAMLREDVRVSLRSDERLSNRQCHHNLAIASVGLCLRDDDLVRAALGSLREQVRYGILDDGLWWEGSPGYHYYAVGTLLELAEMLRRSGLDVVDARLKLAFDGPRRILFPDDTFPALNDSGASQPLNRGHFEFLYSLFHDPRHAALLEPAPGARAQGEAWLRWGEELGAKDPPTHTSDTLPKSGVALLATANGQTAATLHFAPAVLGHGHSDPLGLTLWANGRVQAPDNGARSYFSPVWRFWDRQTLSHNAIVVDEHSAEWERGRFLAFADLPGLQVAAAAADDASPGLRLERSLFLAPGFVADLFCVQPDAGEGGTSALPGWTKEPQDVGSPDGVLRGMAAYERSTQAHTGRFAASLGGTAGRSGAWASRILYRTGQNMLHRRGLIAIASGKRTHLSGWIRTQDATGETCLRLELLSAEGGALGRVETPPVAGTTEWREVRVSGDSPPRAAWARVWLVSNNNGGTAWFDDLSLSQEGEKPVDAAAHNFGFEATAVEHASVDYLYHNYGRLAVDQALAPQERSLGSAEEEPWLDGANGYRFIEQRRWGDASAGLSAAWQEEAEGSGVAFAQAGDPDTQVMAGEGPGPGTARVPLLMARRPGRPTAFLTALAPFRGPRPKVAVSRIAGSAAGKALPSWDAAGLRVERDGQAGLFLRSPGGADINFGSVVLNGRWGAVLPDGALYVLDGTHIRSGGTSLSVAPSPRGRIADSDPEQGVLLTETPLPEGALLRGRLLMLERPYNEAFRIDRVERRGSRWAVVLAERPNLAIRPGTPFSVPNAAALVPVAPLAYRVWSTGDTTLRLPRRVNRAAAAGRDGVLHSLTPRADGNGTSLSLDPTALGGPDLTLILDGPTTGRLDTTPPEITALALDGEAHPVAEAIRLAAVPREIRFQARDESLPMRVTATAGDAPLAVVADAKEQGTFTVGLPAGVRSPIRISVADASPQANARSIRFDVPQRDVIADPKASGGKAVRLASPDATLAARLPLAPGNYELRLVACGPDLASNSLWIDVDGTRQEDVAHLAVGALAPCSRGVELEPALPHLAVRVRPARLVLSLRENPGVTIDRIEVLKDGQVVWQAEAEDL